MFESLNALPADPILGLMAAYRLDTNPNKIDLGVGVYKDESGNTPVMAAVKEAESRLLANQASKSYVGPAGAPDYNRLMAELVIGEDLFAEHSSRLCSFQTPGGCGGLRLGAEFINRSKTGATIWVSDPTWANHVPLLGEAGLELRTYPYYDYEHHGIRFDEMIDTLRKAGPGDLVLLHGCCHNPCGADLSQDQWQAVRDLALDRGFTPFIDLAYQGLGDGLVEDAYGVRLLAESLPEMIIVNSCSKNFGLYRERVGALTVICEDSKSMTAAATQIASIARGIYSMPPDHGAAVVETILMDNELYQRWDAELTVMRKRINEVRRMLVSRLKARAIERDFSFIQKEKGMFSFLGLNPEQVHRLVDEHSVYLVDSSRINVAGVSEDNCNYLVSSLASVLA